MQEILAQVFSVIWGVWRHRWLALGVSWTIAVLGWFWVWQLPESYVASARVYVDTNSLLKPLLQGLTIQPNTEDRIQLLSRTLLSRPNLEKLMRMTDLDLEVTTPQEQGMLISDLKDRISLSGGEHQQRSLYSISVQHPDRETAKRIAQALVTVFIESSLSGKREDVTGSLDYLDDKIREYEDNLMAMEGDVAQFKQQHFDILGVEGGFYRTLGAERTALQQAQQSLVEEENRMLELQRQIAGEDPLYNPVFLPPITRGQAPRRIVAPTAAPIPTPFDAKIYTLAESMNALNLKYTSRHPEVRQAKSLMDELLKEQSEYQAEVRANRRKSDSGSIGIAPVVVPKVPYGGLTSSPVYLDMRKALSESESSIASLEARVQAHEERVAELEAQVGTIPEVEAELSRMEREIQLMTSAHSTMTSKRALARLGQDVEEKASSVNFRVIDPPFVPLLPSEPNKLLLNAIVLGAAILVGVGVGVLFSLISPVVIDPHTLMAITGLPVLGSVSLNLQREDKRKERKDTVAFTSLSLCLILVFVGMTMGQTVLLTS
ncbi:MAG: chain length-determining protein [Halioglobus sp.]|nr:chain length-determining protein [Halioglobus sp.]